jgi:hypothetical protein
VRHRRSANQEQESESDLTQHEAFSDRWSLIYGKFFGFFQKNRKRFFLQKEAKTLIRCVEA